MTKETWKYLVNSTISRNWLSRKPQEDTYTTNLALCTKQELCDLMAEVCSSGSPGQAMELYKLCEQKGIL